MSTTTARTPLNPLDPAGLADLLTADERDVAASVRLLCADRIDPYVGEWFERGEIPDIRGLTKELGALGVLGMHLEGYGCAGMSATEYGLACLELEASDSGIRSLVSVQGSLAMFAIWRFGTEEHKQRWLPDMAAGCSMADMAGEGVDGAVIDGALYDGGFAGSEALAAVEPRYDPYEWGPAQP